MHLHSLFLRGIEYESVKTIEHVIQCEKGQQIQPDQFVDTSSPSESKESLLWLCLLALISYCITAIIRANSKQRHKYLMTTHTGQFHSILIGTVTVHFKGTRQSVWPVFTRLSTIGDVISKSPALIMADNSGHRPFYKYTHTNAIYRQDISIKNTNTISSSDSKRTI